MKNKIVLKRQLQLLKEVDFLAINLTLKERKIKKVSYE